MANDSFALISRLFLAKSTSKSKEKESEKKIGGKPTGNGAQASHGYVQVGSKLKALKGKKLEYLDQPIQGINYLDDPLRYLAARK